MKAHYITTLALIPPHGESDEWEVEHDFAVYSEVMDRVVVIPKGSRTDLASIPRFLPWIYAIMGGRATWPAVIHDFLYRTCLVPRQTADKVLAEFMEVDGLWKWRRALMYSGVYLFGWLSYPDPNDGHQPLEDK